VRAERQCCGAAVRASARRV